MNLRELRFGVEVEVGGQSRREVAIAIQSVVGGTVTHTGYPASHDPWTVKDLRGREWRVVADASLTSVPRHLQAEVVTPILDYNDLEQLQEVVRAVRRSGSRALAEGGIHVHISGDRFDGRSLANLAKLVYKQEPLILHALGVSDARLARYTRPVDEQLIRRIEAQRPTTTDEVNRLWYGYHNANPVHYDSSRYRGLNLHSFWFRKSLEFRYFNSTTHAGKVKAYVQFCLAIAAMALNARAASSKKREFDPHSAKYDFRCWLLRLGLIGNEFKTARLHLMAKMPGSAAWKHGRPAPALATA